MASRRFDVKRLRGILAIASIVVGWGNSCGADPARFWFSLSSTHPYEYFKFSNPDSQPKPVEVVLLPGRSTTLYLWGHPQTERADIFESYDPDPANPESDNDFRQLQNVSFDIKLESDPRVAVDQVLLEGAPTSDNCNLAVASSRFGCVIDSADPFASGVAPSTITYPILSPSGAELFAGFSFSNGSQTGIGPAPGTPANWTLQGQKPAWLLGSVTMTVAGAVEISTSPGRLNSGSLFFSHVGEGLEPNGLPYTGVQFGRDDGPSSVYFHGDDRELIKSMDSPDFYIHVLPGDLDGDGVVGLVDLDRLGGNFLKSGQSPEQGDLTGDGIVGLTDLDFLGIVFGDSIPIPTSGSLSIPEPIGSTLLFLALTFGVVKGRGRWRLIPVALGVFVASSLVEERASAGQLLAEWLSPVNGNWHDPAGWSTTNAPNNGIDNYSVIIDEGPAAYTVLLEAPSVVIDDLTLGSPSATLEISLSNLTLQDLFLDEGLIRLTQAALLSGAEIFPVNGTIEFAGPLGGALSGASLFGDLDLTPNDSRATLINAAAFTGSAIIDGTNSRLSIAQNFSLAGQSVSLGGTNSILEVAGDHTLTIDPASSVVMSGAGASIASVNNDLLLNRGLISAQTAGSRDITLYDFDHRGTVEVLGGTLDLSIANSFLNSGVLRVDNDATLEINVGGDYTLPSGAELRGDGVVRVNGGVSTLINNGKVRPEAFTGVLEIDGNYTQSIGGVLEISMDDEFPGTDDDGALVVNGAASLGGRVEVNVSPGPGFPSGTIGLVFATSSSGVYDSFRFTGLPANISQTLQYSSEGVSVEYGATTNSTLSGTGLTADWNNPLDWSGQSPDSTSIVVIANNRLDGMGQVVTVNPPPGSSINASHSITIDDAVDPIALQINGTNLSVSTTTTIGQNATVQLTGSSQLTSETIAIQGGGLLIGGDGGALVADLEVGLSGSGDATFDPNGVFELEGNYTQGVDGVLLADFNGASLDLVSIEGDVVLDGELIIDLTGVAGSIAPGTIFDLLQIDGDLTGAFDEINVVASDGIVFDPIYQPGSGVDDLSAFSIQARCLGDANGDNMVNDLDAQYFAQSLINNGYTSPNGRNGIQNFDFTSVKNLGGIGVDFLDIPHFTSKLAQSGGMSYAEAQAIVLSSIAEALSSPTVPEPSGSLLLTCISVCLTGSRRRA